VSGKDQTHATVSRDTDPPFYGDQLFTQLPLLHRLIDHCLLLSRRLQCKLSLCQCSASTSHRSTAQKVMGRQQA